MSRFRSLALGLVLPLAALVLPRWYLVLRYSGSIHELPQAPARPTAIVFGAGSPARTPHPPRAPAPPTAIVFGAGLVRSGAPSPVLADRVQAAADLYRRGVVSRILLSGSARGPTYDEPGAMRELDRKSTRL